MSGYRVGKGKPPKSSRFKKGRSGNPKGRPKGSLNLSTLVGEQLTASVTVRENGREKKLSGAKALSMKLFSEAMKGNSKALQTVIVMSEKAAANSEKQRPSDYSAFDLEIIRRFAPPLLVNPPRGEDDDS